MAGSYLAIAIAGGGVPRAALEGVRTRLEQTRDVLEGGDDALRAGLTREDLLGDMFHAGTLGYFAQYEGLSHVAAQVQDAHFQLSTSVGTFGYVPKVKYLFGIPRLMEPGGVEMDLDRVSSVTTLEGAEDGARADFVFQLGAISSALEHAVPEQLFTEDREQPLDGICRGQGPAKGGSAGPAHLPHHRRKPRHRTAQHPPQPRDHGGDPLRVGHRQGGHHPHRRSLSAWLERCGVRDVDPNTGAGAWKIGWAKRFLY
ncbi:MAG: hypothetical protein U5L11_17705 [Arhodomonas sp.]|nr:hypothetical protein [Arhodomonas sp.]